MKIKSLKFFSKVLCNNNRFINYFNYTKRFINRVAKANSNKENTKKSDENNVKLKSSQSHLNKLNQGHLRTNKESSETTEVPYRFRITNNQNQNDSEWSRNVNPKLDYSDLSGNRFPTLSTAQNFLYWKDRGLDQLIQRKFPFKIPIFRKIDPMMREYIFFLHSFDQSRFSDAKIGERYSIKIEDIRKIRERYQTEKMIRDLRLGSIHTRRMTREEAVAQFKEKLYSDYVGYRFKGEEETHTEKQTLGHKATLDWINLQAIQIESISAFPLMEKREPQLKKTEVDITVSSTPKHKIMNWIDPTDKVAF